MRARTLRPAVLACMLLAPAGAAPQAAAVRSDVLVVVQPGAADAAMVIVYPRPTPHARVRAHVQALARAGGWTVRGLVIQDRDIETSPAFGPPKKLGRQTSASFTAAGSPVRRSGAYRLQPFAEALAGLRRTKLVFMEGPDPNFRGLRRFESPEMAVLLEQDGAPYRYRIEHRGGPVPTLPVFEPEPPPAPKAPLPTRAEGRAMDARRIALVLLAASASGLIVLVALLLWGRRSQPPPGRRAQVHRIPRGGA